MNKKILTTSLLIAAFGFSANAEWVVESGGSTCADGGFYVGLNGGISITNVDVKSCGWKNPTAAQVAANLAALPGPMPHKPTKRANIKKTEGIPVVEFVLGGDIRFNDVRAGVEICFGERLGKMKMRYEGTELSLDPAGAIYAVNHITVKDSFYGLGKVKVGYHFTPVLVIYLTAGVEACKTKVSASNTSLHDFDPDLVTPYGCRKKMNWRFVLGIEGEWFVTDTVGIVLRCGFSPKKSIKVSKQLGAQAQEDLPEPLVPTGVKGNVKKIERMEWAFMLGARYRF